MLYSLWITIIYLRKRSFARCSNIAGIIVTIRNGFYDMLYSKTGFFAFRDISIQYSCKETILLLS